MKRWPEYIFWWVNVYHMTGDDGKADIASQLKNRGQLSKLRFTYRSRALLNGDELVGASVWKLSRSAISPADCRVRSVFGADLTNYCGASCALNSGDYIASADHCAGSIAFNIWPALTFSNLWTTPDGHRISTNFAVESPPRPTINRVLVTGRKLTSSSP